MSTLSVRTVRRDGAYPALKGGKPATSWYIIQPSAHRSELKEKQEVTSDQEVLNEWIPWLLRILLVPYGRERCTDGAASPLAGRLIRQQLRGDVLGRPNKGVGFSCKTTRILDQNESEVVERR